jgi:hypothetical protein
MSLDSMAAALDFREWIVLVPIEGDARDLTLLVRNNDRRSGQPSLAAVALGR